MTAVLKMVKPRRIAWGVLAAALVAAGFACDGVTEVGHHFFLILGGVVIGYGAAREQAKEG